MLEHRDVSIKVSVCHPIRHVDVIKAGSLVKGPELSDGLEMREGLLGLRRAEFLKEHTDLAWTCSWNVRDLS